MHNSIASSRRCTLLLTLGLTLAAACGQSSGSPADTDAGSTGATTGTSSTTGSDHGGTTGPASTGGPGSTGTTAPASTGSTSGGGSSTGANGTDGGSGSGTGAAMLAIIGHWQEQYAPGSLIDHMITPDTWTQTADFGTSIYHLGSFDDAAGWVVGQGDASNQYNPSQWSKFQWTHDGQGTLYYCQVVYDAATEADAVSAPAADGTDLQTGCAGFNWSELDPV